MVDVRQVLPNHPSVGSQPAAQITLGYVSYNQTAPTSLTDPIWVLVPNHSSEVPYGPLTWPQSHGQALPAGGDPVVLGLDDNGTVHVLTWDTATSPTQNTGTSLQVASDRPASGGWGLSGTTNTTSNSRLRIPLVHPATTFAVAYGNIPNFDSGSATPNNITVRAALEYGATFVPLFFNGSRDITITPDSIVTSDLAGLPAGAGFAWLRTLVKVTAGQQIPLGYITDNTLGEGEITDTSGTDLTTSGTITASYGFCYGPRAVLAPSLPGQRPLIAMIGDSIGNGQGDAGNGPGQGTYTGDWGFLRRAITGLNPYVCLGQASESAYMLAEVPNRTNAIRLALMAGAKYVLVQHGTNDVNGTSVPAPRTVAQLQGDLATIYGWVSVGGMIPIGVTIPPRTTSTDSWATTANQTKQANDAARVTVNAWIRSQPAPLAGYIELADHVETARDSGLWQVNGAANYYTIDGIHPTTAAHSAIAAGIDTSKFT